MEDEVVVRRHEAQRVHRPPVALDAASKMAQKPQAIAVVEEDRAPVDAQRVDVEVPVRKRRAKHAGHLVR
jgi:hypothetical protein